MKLEITIKMIMDVPPDVELGALEELKEVIEGGLDGHKIEGRPVSVRVIDAVKVV